MPFSEPTVYRPSNLTKKQREQELAAIYGVSMPQEMTDVEASRLRQLLQDHDLKHKPITTIDLNNPPRELYRHQKFPKMLYNHAASHPAHEKEKSVVRGNVLVQEFVQVPAKIVSTTVNSEHELRAAIEDGWSEDAPEFRAVELEPLSGGYQAEANRIEEQIEQNKHRRKG